MYEYENFTNQKQWETYLKKMLQTNNKFLFRAIIVVYNNQTDAEKYAGQSIDWNNKGFSRVDCVEMSRIARTLIAEKKISEKDFWYAWCRMPKYWKQLMVAAKERMARKPRNIQDEFCMVGDQLMFRWCING